MKHKVIWSCLCILLCLSLTACSAELNLEEGASYISDELDLDIKSGKVLTAWDEHGGFHGDGTAYAVLGFSDSSVLEQIENSDDWNPFPLDDTVTILVYGTDGAGPYLTDENQEPLLPKIRNGYYLLIDRQEDQEEPDMLKRYSMNFTLAIYDTDTDRLYYCEEDT